MGVQLVAHTALDADALERLAARSRRPATLRVGVTSVPSPHRSASTSGDVDADLVASVVFETPCRALGGTDVLEATLFAGALRRVEPRIWEGKLRDDLRLSNGDPIHAREVADCLRRASALRGVSVTATRGGLRFTTRVPEDSFMHRLTHASTRLAFRRSEGVLGTGPYHVVQRSAERIELAPNPYSPEHPCSQSGTFGGGSCSPDHIEFVAIPRDDAGDSMLGDALERGAIDLTIALRPDEASRVRVRGREARVGKRTTLLALNTEGVFASAALRRAVAHALASPALLECLADTFSFPAHGVLPPPIAPGLRRAASLSITDGRRPDVRGIAPRRRLALVCLAGPNGEAPALARRVAELLDARGLETRIDVASCESELRRHHAEGRYDLALHEVHALHGEPHRLLRALFAGDAIPADEDPADYAHNLSRIRDPELDALIEAVAHDPSAANLAAVEAHVVAMRPVIPLCHGPELVVHADRVGEVEWGACGLPDLGSAQLAN